MGSVEKEMKVFDLEAASSMVKELRDEFLSGKTRSYEWRVTQLKNIIKMSEDREQDIVKALHSDIGKPEFESSIYEVVSWFHECPVRFMFPLFIVCGWVWILLLQCYFVVSFDIDFCQLGFFIYYYLFIDFRWLTLKFGCFYIFFKVQFICKKI